METVVSNSLPPTLSLMRSPAVVVGSGFWSPIYGGFEGNLVWIRIFGMIWAFLGYYSGLKALLK